MNAKKFFFEGRNKAIISIFIVAILVISIFTAINFKEMNTISAKIVEKEKEPIFLEINANEKTGLTPFEASFKPLVLNNKGDLSYSWDFGDGEKSEEMNPIHTYFTNGTYICNLTVFDTNGKKASDSIIISVKDNQKPTVSIEFETDNPTRPKNFLLEYICHSYSC